MRYREAFDVSDLLRADRPPSYVAWARGLAIRLRVQRDVGVGLAVAGGMGALVVAAAIVFGW